VQVGELSWSANDGVIVMRSPPLQQGEALNVQKMCSYIQKATAAASTGVGVVIVANDVDDGKITMTVDKANQAVRFELALPAKHAADYIRTMSGCQGLVAHAQLVQLELKQDKRS
jgi:hypothetical protein